MVLICPRPGSLARGKVTVSIAPKEQADRPWDTHNLSGVDDTAVTPGREIRPQCRVIGVMGSRTGPLGVLAGAYANDRSKVHIGEAVQVISVPAGDRSSNGFFPGKWEALDVLDVLFWDNPSADALSLEQQEALAEWVHRGGRLIVALGSKSPTFVNEAGPLSRLLPVSVSGKSRTVDNLDPLGEALLGGNYRGKLIRTEKLIEVSVRPGAIARKGVKYSGPTMLYNWARGAGSVTALPISLQEDISKSRFWRGQPQVLAKLVGLNTYARPVDGMSATAVSQGLGSHLDAPGVGSFLVGLAVLMLLVYGLVAGPGTWVYARYINRRNLSWWLFVVPPPETARAYASRDAWKVMDQCYKHQVTPSDAKDEPQPLAEDMFLPENVVNGFARAVEGWPNSWRPDPN